MKEMKEERGETRKGRRVKEGSKEGKRVGVYLSLVEYSNVVHSHLYEQFRYSQLSEFKNGFWNTPPAHCANSPESRYKDAGPEG